MLTVTQGQTLIKAGFTPAQIAQHQVKFRNLFFDIPLCAGGSVNVVNINQYVHALEKQNEELLNLLLEARRDFARRDGPLGHHWIERSTKLMQDSIEKPY